MMEENVWASGTHLYTKLMYKIFWLQHLEVSVWPYRDTEDKSDLVNKAISFLDMAFLPYWVMEGCNAGKCRVSHSWLSLWVDMMRTQKSSSTDWDQLKAHRLPYITCDLYINCILIWFKAVLIFWPTVWQMSMCNMWGVAHINKPVENYYLTLNFPSGLLSVQRLVLLPVTVLIQFNTTTASWFQQKSSHKPYMQPAKHQTVDRQKWCSAEQGSLFLGRQQINICQVEYYHCSF